MVPRTDEDRLGRPIRWRLDGGAIAALGAVPHLVVELDDDVQGLPTRRPERMLHLLELTLNWLAGTLPYKLALGFVATYPIITGVMWTLTSLIFYRRNERDPLIPDVDAYLPFVSVVVAAYCEEAVIERTLSRPARAGLPALRDRRRRRRLDRPHRRDHRALRRTTAASASWRSASTRARRWRSTTRSPCCAARSSRSSTPTSSRRPDTLRHLVTHFRHGRVAAVAGNPQVTNTASLLAKVQATEFASIVSVLRRAQRVWGRILTVSGAICAFRKAAMVDVGLFDPEMATEDIALTWKLQRRFYDVRYEPRAVVADAGARDVPRPLQPAQALGDGSRAGAAPQRADVPRLAHPPPLAGVHRGDPLGRLGLHGDHDDRVLGYLLLPSASSRSARIRCRTSGAW